MIATTNTIPFPGPYPQEGSRLLIAEFTKLSAGAASAPFHLHDGTDWWSDLRLTYGANGAAALAGQGTTMTQMPALLRADVLKAAHSLYEWAETCPELIVFDMRTMRAVKPVWAPTKTRHTDEQYLIVGFTTSTDRQGRPMAFFRTFVRGKGWLPRMVWYCEGERNSPNAFYGGKLPMKPELRRKLTAIAQTLLGKGTPYPPVLLFDHACGFSIPEFATVQVPIIQPPEPKAP